MHQNRLILLLCSLTHTAPLRTDSKATTAWALEDLEQLCPKLLHAGLRASKFFAKRSNCIVLHAETHRSRTANLEENQRKLFQELERIYNAAVPEAQSTEKARKYERL